MANIRVDVNGELTDGMTVTFKAPCDCSEIQGLVIYYNKNGEQHFENFTMKDARVQNLSNVDNLFAAGAYVKVVLDTVNKRAFLQNAATSGYIEEKVTPVDNLESDRADLPLSARMGSELNKNLDNYIRPIDTTKVIKSRTTISSTATYTATENCWIVIEMASKQGSGSGIMINGVMVFSIYYASGGLTTTDRFYLSKGDIVTLDVVNTSHYAVYGTK